MRHLGKPRLSLAANRRAVLQLSAMNMSARLSIIAAALVAIAGAAGAQSSDTPYWAAIKHDEAFLRVGPSPTYPIDWVYSRKGLPLRVVRVNQGWWLVEDPDGVRGWMSASLLTRARGAIVIGEGLAPLRFSTMTV